MRRGQATVLALVLLAVTAMLAGPAAAQEEAPAAQARLLRLQFAPDEVLTYRVEINGVGSVQVMGGAQQIALGGTMDMTLQVEEITEEGNFQILTSLDGANLQVTVAGQLVPMGQRLPQMRAVITPRGQTLSMEMPGGLGSGEMDEQITQLLAGDMFKSLLQVQQMAAFPEAAVAAGAQWGGALAEDEVPEGETPTAITTKYVCDQEFEETNCARLQSQSVIGMGALGEMATTLAMSGTTNSESIAWFDYAAGRTRATEERSQVTVELKVPAAMTGGGGEVGLFLEMFTETKSWLLPPVE